MKDSRKTPFTIGKIIAQRRGTSCIGSYYIDGVAHNSEGYFWRKKYYATRYWLNQSNIGF